MIASLRNTTFLAATAFLVASTVSAQEPDAGRFTGSLRGSSGATGGSMTRVSDATRFSGTVALTPSAARAGAYKVEIRISSTNAASATAILQWSISPGRCGSRLQFLVPPTEVTPLEVRSGGNAEVTWEGPLNLSPSGSYQLVVFGGGGVREQDILACGNLKYDKPKK